MRSQKAACFTTSGLSVLMAHVVSYFWMEPIDKCNTRGPSPLCGKAVCKASEQIKSTKVKSVVTLHSMRCTLHLKRKQTQLFFLTVFFFTVTLYPLTNTLQHISQQDAKTAQSPTHHLSCSCKKKTKHVCTWPRRAQKRELRRESK